jgi:hypothetical protein
VLQHSLWITGATRSGKTRRLVEQFSVWAEFTPKIANSEILVFAATGDNRLDLVDSITKHRLTQGRSPRFDTATPLGFFQDEVILYFPLIVQQLGLKDQFPLRLRPETEQELATQLWRAPLTEGNLNQAGITDYYLVRRTLDILQLAATSGTPPEDIAAILKEGLSEQEGTPELWEAMGEVLNQWRTWNLERGLLTYGILTELYWRYLLPHPVYRQQLKQRYCSVLADDVDEYPAIARSLFEFFLDQEIPVAFTYNPNGAIRLGLGADPHFLLGLADRCQQETLSQAPEDSLQEDSLQEHSLGATWGEAIAQWIGEPLWLPELPDGIQTIQTASRAELLRQIAETIARAIYAGQVQPQDVAVIGPGLDAIARYTLREILTSKGIAVNSLHDQQPLASSPLIRSLLTLLALIYPGLGRLLNRDAIAEMLVLLSQLPDPDGAGRQIDLVRAGLLVDYCFVPDLENPHLLPATTFDRWDRLGFQAAHAYGEILQWVEVQKEQQQQRLIPSPVVLLDRAIQRFLYGGSHLPYDQIAALRELMETAQHYWEVASRLRQSGDSELPVAETVQNFIQLLKGGTITADPYPVRPLGRASQAVTLATIYQYRSDRRFHRWQFWLDAGSPLWLTGGGALFGAPLFLHSQSGRPWTAADTLAANQQRLQRQVLDLLCRAGDRVYLCHSELATNGQEQAGSLLSLVNAATQIPPFPPPESQELEAGNGI